MLCLPFKIKLEPEPWLPFVALRRYGIWGRWMETVFGGKTHLREFVGTRDVFLLGIMLAIGR
jgi:hypothetical protein